MRVFNVALHVFYPSSFFLSTKKMYNKLWKNGKTKRFLDKRVSSENYLFSLVSPELCRRNRWPRFDSTELTLQRGSIHMFIFL